MGKIKTASVSVVVALLVIAVQAFYPAPPPVLAGSQTWYLTDYTTTLTGAAYRGVRDSGNGSTTLLSMTYATSFVWVAASSISADEAANFSLDLSDTWSVTLWADASPPSSTLTVDIGVLSSDGVTFTSKGVSATQTVSSAGGTLSFSVTTTSHTISTGEYLAVRVNNTHGVKAFELDLNGATNSECYVTSDAFADDYPGSSVTISFTITDYGSVGLSFGSLNPGTSDNPEAAQNGTGAVLLTVGAETNVNCSIEVKGDNFEITIESGSATGADSSTVLIDSNQTDLTSTVSAGDKVINTTDGSSGTVQQVDSNTQLTLSAALTGGGDNTFQSGDNYVIIDSSPASTIDISNAKWDTDSGVAGATAMDVTYAQITTSTAGVEKTQDVWHWLSIPNGKEAGDYVGMFYYQAIQ